MKKLLNNKGSALFTVLSVMTMLTIAATATYCVVSANRKSTETHYEDEQAYQTAYSVSSAVSNYIDSYLAGVAGSSGNLTDTVNPLLKKMLALPKNGSMSTVPSDLSTLGMGKYNVTITKTDVETDADGDTTVIFKIDTAAEVSGEETHIVEYKSITTGPTEYFTRFFTSTGNVERDVELSGQDIMTETYFENDYVKIKHGSAININADVYATGTLELSEANYNKPLDIVIGQNFYVTGTGGDSVCNNGGSIYVGGNFETVKEIGSSTSPVTVYVMGDFKMNDTQTIKSGTIMYVNGDCYIGGTSAGATFYVNGNLNIAHNASQGTFYVGETATGYTDKGTVTTGVSSPFSSDKVSAAISTISSKTARQTYVEWKAEDYFNTNYSTASEITPVNGDVISSSCTVHPSNLTWGNTVIFDASASDLYIKLVPTSGNTFSFGTSGAAGYNILITGEHSVVFILPDGIGFKAQDQAYIGHAGWIQKLCGKNSLSEMNATFANTLKDKKTQAAALLENGLIKSSEISSNNPFKIHDNIFLVTYDDVALDFSINQSMFWGFIYAPNALMSIPSNDGRFGFVGGMVVGTYEFKSTCIVMYTRPYDYYKTFQAQYNTEWKPENHIKYLMGVSNGIDYTSATSSLQGFKTLGYE